MATVGRGERGGASVNDGYCGTPVYILRARTNQCPAPRCTPAASSPTSRTILQKEHLKTSGFHRDALWDGPTSPASSSVRGAHQIIIVRRTEERSKKQAFIMTRVTHIKSRASGVLVRGQATHTTRSMAPTTHTNRRMVQIAHSRRDKLH